MASDPVLHQVQLLEEQVQLYRTLNELAERKEQALSTADVAALDHIINTEQTFILKIAELEKRRYAAQKELAAAQNLPIDQISLDFVRTMADEKLSARCQRAGKELSAILLELKDRNRRCQTIIQGALDIVQSTLEKTGPGPKLMDRRV
ncbi:MAG: flagellar protein FlgN [Firmicutes bacterium]|nr:flagellar protein FlgN [Bacillota bacterium]